MIFSHVEENFYAQRLKMNVPNEMPEAHYHDHYELYYLMSGSRKYFINHTIYHIKKGDMVMISPGDLHRTGTDNTLTHERFLINFKKEALKPYLCGMEEVEALSCFRSNLITIPTRKREYVKDLLFRLEQEYPEPDIYAKSLCGHYFMELLLFLNRQSKQQKDLTFEIEVTEEKIQQAARYITTHYTENLTLTQVARTVFMSEGYFSKRFKSVTGFGFSEYLNLVRLRHAAKLLTDTKLPITEIAYQCGFSDSNYFGDVFKKYKGVPPSRYRKEM